MYKNLVKHNGKFHADDVFASVIMTRLFPTLTIVRTRDETVTGDQSNFVYDVGGGAFDHHGIDDTRQHANGVPIAAFGLIWQQFGKQYIADLNPEFAPTITPAVYEKIACHLIIGIDALDNGVTTYQREVFAVSDIINDFCDEHDEVNSFKLALAFSKTMLENRLKKTIGKEISQHDVIGQVTCVSKHILFL